MEKELEIHQKPPQVDGKQTIPLSRKLCIGRGRNGLGQASTDEPRPPKYGSSANKVRSTLHAACSRVFKYDL